MLYFSRFSDRAILSVERQGLFAGFGLNVSNVLKGIQAFFKEKIPLFSRFNFYLRSFVVFSILVRNLNRDNLEHLLKISEASAVLSYVIVVAFNKHIVQIRTHDNLFLDRTVNKLDNSTVIIGVVTSLLLIRHRLISYRDLRTSLCLSNRLAYLFLAKLESPLI